MSRVVNHTEVFVARLLEAARTEVDVALGDLLSDLATDVIGSCIIGYDLGSQTSAEGEREKGPDGILTCLRQSVALQPQFFGSGLSAHIRRLIAIRKLKHYQRYANRALCNLFSGLSGPREYKLQVLTVMKDA